MRRTGGMGNTPGWLSAIVKDEKEKFQHILAPGVISH